MNCVQVPHEFFIQKLCVPFVWLPNTGFNRRQNKMRANFGLWELESPWPLSSLFPSFVHFRKRSFSRLV